MANRFAETLDGVLEEIEKFKNKNADVFVAPGSFEGYSRKADDCVFVRSFFIDLDVGKTFGTVDGDELRVRVDFGTWHTAVFVRTTRYAQTDHATAVHVGCA